MTDNYPNEPADTNQPEQPESLSTTTRSLSFGTARSSKVLEAIVKNGLDSEALVLTLSSGSGSVTPGIILFYPSPEILQRCREDKEYLLDISSELILNTAAAAIQNIETLRGQLILYYDPTQPEAPSSSVKES